MHSQRAVAPPVEEIASHDAREATLAAWVDTLPFEAIARDYALDDGMVVFPSLLPRALVTAMIAEARGLKAGARRTLIPFVRRGGAIAHPAIEAGAPTLLSLQRSPSLMSFCERITGPRLEPRLAGDPHASALYIYDRKGDHVGWHKDDCGCEPEASFTMIVGLVDEGSSKLEFDLWKDTHGKRTVRRSVATTPGTLVFFCGSKAHHRVTPLASDGQERISFSFVYVKDGHHPTGINAIRQTAINTFLYFGVRGVDR